MSDDDGYVMVWCIGHQDLFRARRGSIAGQERLCTPCVIRAEEREKTMPKPMTDDYVAVATFEGLSKEHTEGTWAHCLLWLADKHGVASVEINHVIARTSVRLPAKDGKL